MKIARWGNSLALRLPRSYIEALALEEGDEVDIPPEAIRKIASASEKRRSQAIEALLALRWEGSPGYRFDRDEVYDQPRGRDER